LRDLRAFPWLDPPPDASLQRAERLLVQLGAVDESSGSVSAIGRRMLKLSVARAWRACSSRRMSGVS